MIRASPQWPSVRSRLASWETGLRGVAERPLLGWGPENFVVVFGRYARGLATTSESHDRAHNKLIEVAATTGLAGLSLWLALWGLAVVVFLRAARNIWNRRTNSDEFLTADPGLSSCICARPRHWWATWCNSSRCLIPSPARWSPRCCSPWQRAWRRQ